MIDDVILKNILNTMNNFGIPHQAQMFFNVIIVPNTDYKMVFNTNTTPWTCHLMKNNEEIFKGNPTSVIINLKYRLNKGI